MSPSPDNSYARWLLSNRPAFAFSDGAGGPPERLLQAVWQHQRLRRDQLKTLDGKTARVLHPGFANAEGGPDFRGAVIRFDGQSPQTGDVEVDVRTNGWKTHGHDRNPNFKNVILHVVWDGDHAAPGAGLTTVRLRDALDAPLEELALWLEHEPIKPLPEMLRGKCSAPLRELNEEQRNSLLLQAAQVRFESKSVQLLARARHAGWEQALWEGLFRGLGYKHNLWPMQYLAETRGRWSVAATTPLTFQARLLGIGGLLPTQLAGAKTAGDGYVRQLWDEWWRERDGFEDCSLPRDVWRFHGLRPANHPQRRLALASHWLAAGDLPARLERWCAADLKDNALLSSLMKVLQAGRDDFWSWHWTLRSARLVKPQPLLGEKRVTDLAANVILPWLSARAREGGNSRLWGEIQRRFQVWPAAEDNSVLKLARQRLLGGGTARNFQSAATQQGLMQIVRDFCDHSNAVCDDCRFPELVRTLATH